MKRLTKQEKHERRKDTKNYFAAAVLDRVESDRHIRPLPTKFEIRGRDGRILTLTLTPQPMPTQEGEPKVHPSKPQPP